LAPSRLAIAAAMSSASLAVAEKSVPQMIGGSWFFFTDYVLFFVRESLAASKHRPVFSWRNHFVVSQIKLILRISGNLKHHPPIKQRGGIAHDIDARRLSSMLPNCHSIESVVTDLVVVTLNHFRRTAKVALHRRIRAI
jgi:hypothetical protein